MSHESIGLYDKFNISRTDGRSEPGEKHHGCEYFVLDMTHDPHAVPALKAYAESCAPYFPLLSIQLLAKISSKERS